MSLLPTRTMGLARSGGVRVARSTDLTPVATSDGECREVADREWIIDLWREQANRPISPSETLAAA